MFGFSRRRMKLGRLKVHLGDPMKGNRSPMRPSKQLSKPNEENEVLASASGRSDNTNCQSSFATLDPKPGLGSWTELTTEGEKPSPRFNHATAIVGSKMVLVGGDTGKGLLDDTWLLSLDGLTWAVAAPKVYFSPNAVSVKIPACKGHSLVSWGKSVLLVGGKTNPASDRVSVWSFDVEAECWSYVEAKGDIPVARNGHTVTRAGSVLILFGGEDVKGRKLNDLHMFDLKSSTWLPLSYTGTGPSPRSKHVAALYDEKILFVFGGQSKSRILNDFYSLDFEKMVWSRIKIRGHHPSPRAGCCGALCGTKWYITGGGSKKKRHAETLIFDILKFECAVPVTSPSTSIIASRGFSIVPVHHKGVIFLVAFGGYKKEPSDQVEIMFLANNELSESWRSAPDIDLLPYEDCPATTAELSTHHTRGSPISFDHVARNSLATLVEQQISGRRSLSDDPISLCAGMSLHKQFHREEDYNVAVKMQKPIDDEEYTEGSDRSILSKLSSQAFEQRSKRQEAVVQMDIAGILASTEEMPFEPEGPHAYQKHANNNLMSNSNHIKPYETEGRSILTNPSDIYHLYETRIATLTRKNVLLEEQLRAAMASQESAEKNLSSALRSRQDMERKLADTVKEVELMKEKLGSMELAQEESNSLSNIVHSDNVRLEHDVAFLKAILDDTQKELHSTRGVLTAERARAFQLQVELFHLKQRLQSMENTVPTPRKPFNM